MAVYSLLKEASVVYFIVSCLFIGIFGQDFSDKCGAVLPGCFCTDYYIDCQGAEFQDIREIYPFITKQTYRIHMTGGNLISIPRSVFTNDELIGPLTELKYLNLSDNGIRSIDEAAFLELPNLKTLDLSYNDVYINTSKWTDIFYSLLNVETLRLRHMLWEDMSMLRGPGFMFLSADMSHLTHLDISLNGLDIIDDDMKAFLCETYTLTSFNVADNLFRKFPIPLCMNNLKMLDLSNNKITSMDHVDVEIIESFVNLDSIKLGGNPFKCYCNLYDLISWVNETDILADADQVTCAKSENASLIGEPLKGLEIVSYCEPRIPICYGPRDGHVVHLAKPVFTGIIIVSIVIAAVVISSCVVYCRRRSRRHDKTTTTTTTKLGTESRMTGDVSKSTLYSRMV